jgi:hypothetical protein
MKLTDFINAAFSGIWIETRELEESEREIVQQSRQQRWRIATWNIANGLRFRLQLDASATEAGEPLAAIRALPALASSSGTAIHLLHHFSGRERLLGRAALAANPGAEQGIQPGPAGRKRHDTSPLSAGKGRGFTTGLASARTRSPGRAHRPSSAPGICGTGAGGPG